MRIKAGWTTGLQPSRWQGGNVRQTQRRGKWQWVAVDTWWQTATIACSRTRRCTTSIATYHGKHPTDRGSVDDTDGNRVVTRRARIPRERTAKNVGHEADGQKLWTRQDRLDILFAAKKMADR